jgi:hypothetical protein
MAHAAGRSVEPTSCVPNLKLDPLSVKLDSTDLEVDSDCGDKARCKAVFTKTQQTTRFSDTGITDQQQLYL